MAYQAHVIVILGLPLAVLEEWSFREIQYAQFALRHKQIREDAVTARLTAVVASALSGDQVDEDLYAIDSLPFEYTKEKRRELKKAMFSQFRKELDERDPKLKGQANKAWKDQVKSHPVRTRPNSPGKPKSK